MPATFALPPLPGFTMPASYAAWPVWSDSTQKEIRFQPMPKKAATKLWHRARDFDRQTSRMHCHGGAVGHSALQVLHTLIFDFLNYRSGRLDPSYAAIARKANVCERTVANAIKRLRDLGILNWVRRCAETWRDGRYSLEQETNAYAVLPSSQWRGYVEPPEAPAPQSGTWGDHPCGMRAPMIEADIEQRSGSGMEAVIRQLELDERGGLSAALASLGKTMLAKNPQ
jgi:hypothetical protein